MSLVCIPNRWRAMVCSLLPTVLLVAGLHKWFPLSHGSKGVCGKASTGEECFHAASWRRLDCLVTFVHTIDLARVSQETNNGNICMRPPLRQCGKVVTAALSWKLRGALYLPTLVMLVGVPSLLLNAAHFGNSSFENCVHIILSLCDLPSTHHTTIS